MVNPDNADAMARPKFKVLRQALLDLGFQEVAQTRPRYVFEHPESGTVLLFRKFDNDELVDLANLVGVYRHLEYRMGVEEKEFEEMLRERSLAG